MNRIIELFLDTQFKVKFNKEFMKRNLTLLFSLLFFSSFLLAQQQLENPGFEDWEEIGLGPDILEPVNWSTLKTSDDPDFTNIAPITWERTTDAHTGQYAVKLSNVSVLGISVPGTISNGRFHPNFDPDIAYIYTDASDPQWCYPYTQRPDSIVFWMKFFPVDNDILQFQALLHVDEGILPAQDGNTDNWVGYTRADIGGTHDTWTRVSLPFEYYDNRTPEYLLIICTSGNGTTPVIGSYAYFDDIEIIGGQQSAGENPLEQVQIYVKSNYLYVNNLSTDIAKKSSLEIIDLAGRTVLKSELRNSRISLPGNSGFSGIYLVKILSNDFFTTRKIIF